MQGVTVIHVPGHIEPDAAHSVHDLAHGLPLHNHLIVRLKAHQLGNLLVEILDAPVSTAVPVVNRVDLLDIPGDIHHSVPGNGHHRGLLVGHVVAGQQHRVRIAAAPRVPAQDQNCVVVLTLPLPVAAGAGPLAPVDLLHRIGGFFRLLGLCLAGVEVRPDEQALPGQNSRQGHSQNCGCGNQPLLPPGQSGPSLWGTSFSIHLVRHGATPFPSFSSR
ncbi:Uncharacterised protein [uncultured Blautia sp.]|nr:Uncharacterised protein [uncultured Blautia sp.]